MMIPKAHIPILTNEICAQSIMTHIRTAECEGELEEGNCGTSTGTKTAIHDSYI